MADRDQVTSDPRNDIVRRLRLDASPECAYRKWSDLAPLALEAADEIEHLRDALRQWKQGCAMHGNCRVAQIVHEAEQADAKR